MKDQTLIEKLLDENNTDDIVLYDENDNEVKFEQVALIPLDEELYVILKPINKIEGIEDDEALVFVINEDEEDQIDICDDMDIVNKVFEEYYKLLDEEEK
ncbi:MAG: DUF1292 domain-containing protein [Erysipelotrichales bacterium]|nr:DUF1292 domain-containing protein [Erysipelotrichales bacterium]